MANRSMNRDATANKEDSRGMNRTQSRVDDALVQFNENIEELESTISNLETCLSFVLNDHPRADGGDVPEQTKPTGDSSLLTSLHRQSVDVSTQANRIRSIIARLDI
jgi:hypothetical protein